MLLENQHANVEEIGRELDNNRESIRLIVVNTLSLRLVVNSNYPQKQSRK